MWLPSGLPSFLLERPRLVLRRLKFNIVPFLDRCLDGFLSKLIEASGTFVPVPPAHRGQGQSRHNAAYPACPGVRGWQSVV